LVETDRQYAEKRITLVAEVQNKTSYARLKQARTTQQRVVDKHYCVVYYLT